MKKYFFMIYINEKINRLEMIALHVFFYICVYKILTNTLDTSACMRFECVSERSYLVLVL